MQRNFRALLLIAATIVVVVVAVVLAMPEKPMAQGAPSPTVAPIPIRLVSSGVVEDMAIEAIAKKLTAENGYAIVDAAEEVFVFYRSASFHEGTLVLAGVAGKTPSLYYIENGKIVCSAENAAEDKLHLTRLFGDTILFGTSFAVDETDPDQVVQTTRIMVSFLSGETMVSALYPFTIEDTTYPGGYILLGNGTTQLSAVTIYDGDEVIAPATWMAIMQPTGTPWEDTDRAIWNETQYLEMRTGDAQIETEQLALAVESPDGTVKLGTVQGYRNDLNFTITDAWRNGNATCACLTVRDGDTVSLSHIPEATGLVRLALIEQDTGSGVSAATSQYGCQWDEESGVITLPDISEVATRPCYGMLVIWADTVVYAVLLELA